jgi:hypothetical protein
MDMASVHTCTVPCILRGRRSRSQQLCDVDTRISETFPRAVTLAEDVRQARA